MVRTTARLLRAILIANFGVGTAIAAAAVHSRWWGLVLGLAASAAVAYALPPRWSWRLPFCLAWAGMVLYLGAGRTEGDFLVSATPVGYIFQASALVMGLSSVTALVGERGGEKQPESGDFEAAEGRENAE